MIERVTGCSHISCPCGHEFCIRCGHTFINSGYQCCRETVALYDMVAEAARDALFRGPTWLDSLWIPIRRVLNMFRVRDDGMIRDNDPRSPNREI
ncbi:hypothetical protein FPOAC1_012500 [Fusarium poae]|uniref:IBR domain-containing protein n=1 Tax=Fusarium poae TaxID=36050 RepID=A0A1B8AH62_FUSPO|nr:hypothetical protein FPOAC1_012500 [Fusarium poae]KAG8667667.1 hypothetical protein FPOAC1_012500 [Fusarium poae]OBS19888.1 hypothetical protein FPOA_11613 [Fusarium poae]